MKLGKRDDSDWQSTSGLTDGHNYAITAISLLPVIIIIPVTLYSKA